MGNHEMRTFELPYVPMQYNLWLDKIDLLYVNSTLIYKAFQMHLISIKELLKLVVTAVFGQRSFEASISRECRPSCVVGHTVQANGPQTLAFSCLAPSGIQPMLKHHMAQKNIIQFGQKKKKKKKKKLKKK